MGAQARVNCRKRKRRNEKSDNRYMQFTTRPEIKGTFGVTASTHWLASATGFGLLERGGNAFDAATAMGFVLQIVEPHLNGPGGEFPAIFHNATTGKTEVLCAQGPAPAGATIEHYRREGLSLIPGSGLLATVIPGAFDGWMTLMRDHGSMRLRDVLEPAIHYARHGHPILPRVCETIDGLCPFFEAEWPTSFATWCPGGNAPKPDSLFCNEALADTYERILREVESVPGREAQFEAARKTWAQGFVAEEIGKFLAMTEVMDASDARHNGVLTADDMASWQCHYEAPQTFDYQDYRIAKTGPWGQGPVLLQALALLKGFDLAGPDPNGPEFVHLVVEAMKLAYADREAFYGDPDFSEIPLATLLNEEHNAARRALIGEQASLEQRASELPGLQQLAQGVKTRARDLTDAGIAPSAGEPTMSHLTERRGDTVHIDVIDCFGNMIAVTPSGGWLQSSPIVPSLGFALNSRAQMFWLDEGLPQSLAPGRRPRTTLSPTLAYRNGEPSMVFGTPGGDQQDQWQLVLFLRHVHHGLNLQEAIDAPLFHSQHFTSSFFPRTALPGEMMIEATAPQATLDDLRRRGHILNIAEPWSVGRLCAAKREPNGLLRAAATPRLMQAYAIGR